MDPEAAARTTFATIVGLDEVSQRESGGEDLIDRSREFWELPRLALAANGESHPETENERR